ncbi:MAG TPA: adenylate kinase [Anaeromyxobacteraceae bacterium]|nr:adenylate kinase [Anaeromyxobacteraceae bacterium]
MILILLGPPGAGKGTQAKLLARDLQVPHISTGDMFRDHKARGTEIGKRVQAIMDSGGLVPDEITNQMVKERLSRPDVVPGFILDGYPRTRAQAEFLDAVLRSLGRRLDRVLSYEVSTQLLVERLGGRRSCPRCGAVYHLSANPPRKPGVCDRDGAELVLRADDRPETVTARLEEYQAKTEPLKRYYHERGILAEVSGIGSPDEILAAAKRILGRG